MSAAICLYKYSVTLSGVDRWTRILLPPQCTLCPYQRFYNGIIVAVFSTGVLENIWGKYYSGVPIARLLEQPSVDGRLDEDVRSVSQPGRFEK